MGSISNPAGNISTIKVPAGVPIKIRKLTAVSFKVLCKIVITCLDNLLFRENPDFFYATGSKSFPLFRQMSENGELPKEFFALSGVEKYDRVATIAFGIPDKHTTHTGTAFVIYPIQNATRHLYNKRELLNSWFRSDVMPRHRFEDYSALRMRRRNQSMRLVGRIKDTPLIIAMVMLSVACITLASRVVHPHITKVSSGLILGPDRPFAQGHASTIVKAGGGNYLVAWFGGTHEKHPDVGIWLSRGDGRKWSHPVEVAKVREDAHWNPVLFKATENEITLFFKVGKTIDKWETWYMTSVDQGATWSEPVELVKGDRGGRGPVRNKPIRLSNGVLISGASNEKNKVWNAFVDRSEDNGKTWSATPYLTLDRKDIVGEGIIQPTLWESSPGHVHMLLRSSCGAICRSDSKDYGKTWSKVYRTSLPNPNSGIDLVKLSNGNLALVYNPDNKNWGDRNPLKLAVSSDNGNTWPVQTDIETGSGEDEFSYPAIVASGDTVSVTYTWKRQNVAFWQGVIR